MLFPALKVSPEEKKIIDFLHLKELVSSDPKLVLQTLRLDPIGVGSHSVKKGDPRCGVWRTFRFLELCYIVSIPRN